MNVVNIQPEKFPTESPLRIVKGWRKFRLIKNDDTPGLRDEYKINNLNDRPKMTTLAIIQAIPILAGLLYVLVELVF